MAEIFLKSLCNIFLREDVREWQYTKYKLRCSRSDLNNQHSQWLMGWVLMINMGKLLNSLALCHQRSMISRPLIGPLLMEDASDWLLVTTHLETAGALDQSKNMQDLFCSSPLLSSDLVHLIQKLKSKFKPRK